MRLSGKGPEWNVKMNLILGVDTGDGRQDSFEGRKCFGWSLREIDDKCDTPKSPVNRASLFNWWWSIRTKA